MDINDIEQIMIGKAFLIAFGAFAAGSSIYVVWLGFKWVDRLLCDTSDTRDRGGE